MDVAILVGRFGFADTHSLVPTVHSGNRIGMNGKSQVLMHVDIVPPNAQSVGVARFVRLGAALAFQSPLAAFMIEPDCGHQLSLSILMNFPTPHVMTARDDARLDSFSY